MKVRTWKPEPGRLVKLASMACYRELAPQGTPLWAWLRVLNVSDDGLIVELQHVEPQRHDAPMRVVGGNFGVPLEALQAPIGWKERYSVHASPEALPAVLGWLPKGLSVHASHDLNRAGTLYFMALDQDGKPQGKPHWSTPEVTDIIPADQVRDLIQVVKFEESDQMGLPKPCPYCVDGKRVPGQTQVKDSVKRCEKCGKIEDFSYAEEWHFPATGFPRGGSCDCDRPHPPAWCWVCSGTGLGTRYLSEMDKKERTQAIKTLTSQGWKVYYDRRLGCYIGERETIVKDFGQEVSNGQQS